MYCKIKTFRFCLEYKVYTIHAMGLWILIHSIRINKINLFHVSLFRNCWHFFLVVIRNKKNDQRPIVPLCFFLLLFNSPIQCKFWIERWHTMKTKAENIFQKCRFHASVVLPFLSFVLLLLFVLVRFAYFKWCFAKL